MPGMDDSTIELVLEVMESDTHRELLKSLRDGGERGDELSGSGAERSIDFLSAEGLIEKSGSKLALTERGTRILEYATRDWNPSREGTKRGKTYEILSDCEWHCSACELPSSQPAKDIQMLRKEGFEFVQESGQGKGAFRHCRDCDSSTFHRKLKYPFPTGKSITRQAMPESFKRRVRELYDYRDSFDGSSPSMTLEVDHRIPEIRWDESEDFDYEAMTDEDIREHFQILSRSNNLLKSRKCEECVKTGIRPPFMEINFYYDGDERYDEELGCIGCGWYNPQEWRSTLEDRLDESG